jgi:hypothetical protein
MSFPHIKPTNNQERQYNISDEGFQRGRISHWGVEVEEQTGRFNQVKRPEHSSDYKMVHIQAIADKPS